MANDQFFQGRIPVKLLPYSRVEDAQTREILIDYEGTNPTFDIFVVDVLDRTKVTNISELLRNAFPKSNADEFRVTINGELNPDTIKNIVNDLYSKILFHDGIFDKTTQDFEALFNSNTKSIMLKDKTGNLFIPVNTAENVFDKNGISVEERLDAYSRVSFSNLTVTASQTNQTVFTIDYPFMNYMDYGNYFELRIGTVFIDKSRYQLINNVGHDGNYTTGSLTLLDTSLELNRNFNILFIFNASTTTTGDFLYTDGSIIANGTLRISALDKYSDNPNLPDSTSVATSKALYNLREELLISDSSRVYLKPSANTAALLTLPYAGELTDGLHIITTSSVNTTTSFQIKIGTTTYTIYKEDGSAINYSINAGALINLLYLNGKFYILTIYDYSIVSNRFVYTANDADTVIPFTGLFVTENDEMLVYRNGARLFPVMDYSTDTVAKTITVYVRAEENDKFVFEVLRTVRR